MALAPKMSRNLSDYMPLYVILCRQVDPSFAKHHNLFEKN